MKGTWQIKIGVLVFNFPDIGPVSETLVLELIRSRSLTEQMLVQYYPASNYVEPEKEFNAWGERIR